MRYSNIQANEKINSGFVQYLQVDFDLCTNFFLILYKNYLKHARGSDNSLYYILPNSPHEKLVYLHVCMPNGNRQFQ